MHASGVRSPRRRCVHGGPRAEESGSLELIRVPSDEHGGLSTISAGPACLFRKMVAGSDMLPTEAMAVSADGTVAG